MYETTGCRTGERHGRRRAVASLVAVALLTAGCATSSGGQGSDSAAPASVAATTPNPAELASLLPSDALKVDSTARYVTSELLAKDAPVPGLAVALVSMGFLRGVQRNFQGESKHISLAVSRTLRFADAAGAARFVAFVHSNRVDYFGIGAESAALRVSGRTGFVFQPPACACHMAQPDVVGIVARGDQVTWLEINGPDATPALLRELIARTGGS